MNKPNVKGRPTRLTDVVQIAVNKEGQVYALDSKGQVWLNKYPDYWDPSASKWQRVAMGIDWKD